MRRRLAVMQPYFLPYVGYWQLLAAVDELIVYDTVQLSSGGWVNRNRIRCGDEIRWITVPVERAPHRTPIRDRRLTSDDAWRPAMRRRVAEAYRSAPCRTQGLDLLDAVLDVPDRDLTGFLIGSIELVTRRLGISVAIRRASELGPAPSASGPEERLLALCRQVGTTDYFNLPGGRDLYDPEHFRAAGMSLHLLVPPDPAAEDTPTRDDQTLSVLDLFMRHPADDVAALVDDARWCSWTAHGALATPPVRRR